MLLAAAALVVGVLVYLLDRSPGSAYFLPASFSLADGRTRWFGDVGGYLPDFLHVYALSLLTAAVLGATPRAALAAALSWWTIDSLFELGQHPLISLHISATVPAWFDGIPFLENTAAYFTRGTFDQWDLVAIALGALAAYGILVLIPRKGRSHPRANAQIYQVVVLTAVLALGLLAILGSGGGGGGGGGGSANSPPIASFTVSPQLGSAPLPVTFDASGSSDSDGSIAAYQWDFGDGSTGIGRTLSHTYQAVRRYTVTLTVTDNSGATASATRTIDVSGPWIGTYQTSLIAEAHLYAEIRQTTDRLWGTFRDEEGRRGDIAGTVSGQQVALTISETTPGCNGSFSGTGQLTLVNGLNAVEFTFTGSNCEGSHANGQGLLIAQNAAVLAWGQVAPTGLTASGSELFWTDDSDEPLKKGDMATGAVQALTVRMKAISSMTLEGADLLWTDEAGDIGLSGCVGTGLLRVLQRSSLDGATTTPLAVGDYCMGGAPEAVSDGTNAYWVTSVATPNIWHIERVSLSDSSTAPVVSTNLFIQALGHDATHLYWSESDQPALIRRCAFSDCAGSVQTLYSSTTTALSANIAVTNDYVVFAELIYSTSPYTARLLRIAKSGSAPTEIATGIEVPRRLASDGVSVYWIGSSTLYSIPITGGTVTALVTGLSDPQALVFDGDRVVWSEMPPIGAFLTGRIRAIPKTGGAAETLVANAAMPFTLARASNGDLYWADGSAPPYSAQPFPVSGISKRTAAGTTQTVLNGVAWAPSIAVDSSHVYVPQHAWIKRVPRAGGNAEIVALDDGLEGIASVATDGSYVYWITGGLRNVKKVPVGGGQITLLAAGNGSGDRLRVHGGNLYWILSIPPPDRILRVSASGGPVITVASGLAAPDDLVVDDNFIYFSEYDTGNISKVSSGGGVPSVIGSGLRYSWNRLAQDETSIYWVHQLELQKVAKTGGAQTVLKYNLLQDAGWPAGIAVGDQSVFWTETLLGVIKKEAK
jgi:PKD repeat protein